MSGLLRSLFGFVLNPLESGTEPYRYKPSHRLILKVMGGLFLTLACGVVVFAYGNTLASVGHYVPAIVFGLVGVMAMLVGFVGNDRAVAKIWGSR